MTTALLLGLIVLAYVLGSVPFGLLVGLARGIDVRTAGSGNIGATNVGRLLGGKFFALVFFLDLLKGLLPMLAGAMLLRGQRLDLLTYLLWLLVGFATILGHMYSLFLGFKGGKGVATSAGVMLGLWPYYTLAGLIGLAVFIVLVLLTRYVSVASMGGAVTFPIAYVAIALTREPPWPLFDEQLPLLVFAIVMAVLIVYKHRSNIARLRAGTEPRVTKKSA